MSRSNDRRNDPRFDSALSLAFDQQLSLRTSAGLHGPPALQPWSSYNVRQESLTSTESMDETPASSVYEVDTNLTTHSTPPKALMSIPRSSSPLALPSASGGATSGVISCGQCGTYFTGTYRRGNLARHVRQKHGQANGRSYICRAPNCLHDFRRQDARLKHERKLHPELEHALVKPRQHHEQSSSEGPPYQMTSDCIHGVSHDAEQLAIDHSKFNNGILPTAQDVSIHEHTSTNLLATWQTFARLHTALDEENYSHACDTLFTRWESIAQELKDKGSDAYNVYAQALDDIYFVIAAIDCETPVDRSEEAQDQAEHLRQHRPYQETAHRGRGAATPSGSGTTSTAGHNDIPRNLPWRPTEPTSGKTVIGRKANGRKCPILRVDCPMYKHWLMYRTENIPPPCQGCSARGMNQVRNHVKQRHVGEHVGMIPFFHHCTRCEGNFVDFMTGNNHRVARACAHTLQPRNNIITPWAQLYLAIYSSATQVPRPFTGETGFLPPAVVTQCRPSTRSFLDQRFSGIVPEHPQRSSENAPSTEQPIYDAIMHTMLQEANSYLPSGNSHTDTNIQAMNTPHPVVPGVIHATYQDQLYNAQSYLLGILLNAPRYMSAEQIAGAVHFLQQIADIVRAFHVASMAPAVSTVDTQLSSENCDNVFSDLALSPQTDQTSASNVLPVSPTTLCEYGRSPPDGTHMPTTLLPVDNGQHDLAFLFNPSTLDLGSDMGDADFAGPLHFGTGD